MVGSGCQSARVSSFNLAATPAFLPKFTEAPSAPKPINMLSRFFIPSVSKELLIVAIRPDVKISNNVVAVFYQLLYFFGGGIIVYQDYQKFFVFENANTNNFTCRSLLEWSFMVSVNLLLPYK